MGVRIMIYNKTELYAKDMKNNIESKNSLPILLGEKIRFYRKKKEMSLEILATHIHKSKATLSKYESGAIAIDIITLFEIAEALKVDMKEFLPCTKAPQSKFTDTIFDMDKPIYMYHFTNQTVHTSIIKMKPDDTTNEINVTLHYIVTDFEDLNLCSCLYHGTLKSSYSIATFLLDNHYNSLETAMITLSITLKKQSYYMGFLTGIHFDYLKPSVFKVMLTQTPFEGSNSELKKYLYFSKQDEMMLKNKNYLTLLDN